MPIIPILGIALPALIKVAERLFSGENKQPGSMKKFFVMNMISKLYDAVHLEKIVPDVPGLDEKALIMDFVSILIDRLVPELLNERAKED